MSEKMWFGSLTHAQWVPVPLSGMERTKEGYSEEILLDNGGAWMERSAAHHNVFPMSFPVKDASEYQGIEAFARFADGEYGSDFVRFVDPMYADLNLFPPNWASPGLTEEGWKPIYDVEPTFSDTPSNVYGKPRRSAVYSVTTLEDVVPSKAYSKFTILIPPTHTLHLGVSGLASGSAVVQAQPYDVDGIAQAVQDLTLSSQTAAPSLDDSFDGSTYSAVEIYITRTTSAESTITLTSMWAQILKTGISPSISRHIPGHGHMGLTFRGNARAESYIMADGHKVGAEIELIEVEPWA